MIRAIIAWGPAAIWAAVLFLLSELRGDSSIVWLAVHDKVVHVVLYAVMGTTLAWGRHRSPFPVPHALALLIGFGYGAVDEWHQSFVPGRFPAVDDFLADVAGVLLGYLLFFGLRRVRGLTSPAESVSGKGLDSK